MQNSIAVARKNCYWLLKHVTWKCRYTKLMGPIMKTLLSSAFVITCLFATSAFAESSPDGFFFKPYVGAAYNRYDINYKAIPTTQFSFGDFSENTLHGFNLSAGARIHKYLGVEASYLRALKDTKTGPASIESSNHGDGIALDVMGYYPIDATNIELIASVGATYTSYIGNSTNANFAVDTNELKARVGGGAQYWLTDSINVRGLLHYQDAEYAGKTVGATTDGTANNTWITSIGINLTF